MGGEYRRRGGAMQEKEKTVAAVHQLKRIAAVVETRKQEVDEKEDDELLQHLEHPARAKGCLD